MKQKEKTIEYLIFKFCNDNDIKLHVDKFDSLISKLNKREKRIVFGVIDLIDQFISFSDTNINGKSIIDNDEWNTLVERLKS